MRDVILRRWRMIAALLAACLMLGIIYIETSPALYTATATMVIDTKRTTLQQAEVSIDNRLVDDPTIESEIETIKSERVAAAVVNRTIANSLTF